MDESFVNDQLLQPDFMVYLYSQGAFPMADENGTIDWYMPEVRTIIRLDDYNYPRSLRKFLETSDFEFRYDYDAVSVIRGCADREETWISEKLIDAYKRLIDARYLHSVEVYRNNMLVGGLYGIAVNGAFFGESMFSRVPQASKCALIRLIERLNEKGFVLLDVQYMTEHLKMFGAAEISLAEFKKLLKKAADMQAEF